MHKPGVCTPPSVQAPSSPHGPRFSPRHDRNASTITNGPGLRPFPVAACPSRKNRPHRRGSSETVEHSSLPPQSDPELAGRGKLVVLLGDLRSMLGRFDYMGIWPNLQGPPPAIPPDYATPFTPSPAHHQALPIPLPHTATRAEADPPPANRPP
jgi:hypothetical protein